MAALPASKAPALDSLAASLSATLSSMRDARALVEARDLADERESVRFVSTLFPDCVVALCAFNHPGVFQPPAPSRDPALGGLATRDERAFYESLYDRVVDEDRAAIPVLFQAMQTYLRERSADIAAAGLRARLLYRRPDTDGFPAWICDEKLVFQTRAGKHLHVTVLRRASRPPAPPVATLVCEQEVGGGVAHLATFTARGRAGDGLTAREAQITALVARGLSTKQIAAELGLSSNTVRNCRSRVLRKTGAANAAELSARWR
jgi:DNA-binding CsgD family transcriptional regulator